MSLGLYVQNPHVGLESHIEMLNRLFVSEINELILHEAELNEAAAKALDEMKDESWSGDVAYNAPIIKRELREFIEETRPYFKAEKLRDLRLAKKQGCVAIINNL